MIATTQLNGAIFLYRFDDPMRIIDVFVDLVERQLIGYKKYDVNLDGFVIDLHFFQLWTVQFIIRYLFGFEWKQLSELMIGDKLWIITGKGKHDMINDKKGKVKDFLIKELMAWEIPIKCNVGTRNAGMVFIHTNDLLPYLNDNNCAKHKFTVPSTDWFYEDPRESLINF